MATFVGRETEIGVPIPFMAWPTTPNQNCSSKLMCSLRPGRVLKKRTRPPRNVAKVEMKIPALKETMSDNLVDNSRN
jgi:hypothetical protein